LLVKLHIVLKSKPLGHRCMVITSIIYTSIKVGGGSSWFAGRWLDTWTQFLLHHSKFINRLCSWAKIKH